MFSTYSYNHPTYWQQESWCWKCTCDSMSLAGSVCVCAEKNVWCSFIIPFRLLKHLSSLELPSSPLFWCWQRDSSPTSTSQLSGYGNSPSTWITAALPLKSKSAHLLDPIGHGRRYHLVWTEEIKRKKREDHLLKPGQVLQPCKMNVKHISLGSQLIVSAPDLSVLLTL